MSFTKILTSVHGRRLGLSASGGLLFAPTTSTGFSHFAEISSAGVFNSSISGASAIGAWGSSLTKTLSFVEKVESSGTLMKNHGLSHVTSDVVQGSTLLMSAPEVGVNKEIWFDCSASTITIGSTDAGITFGTSVGTSALNMDTVGGLRGVSIVLKGLSDTRWAILGGRQLGDFADG